MLKYSLSTSEAVASCSNFLRAAAVLSSVIVAVGFVGTASAQSPKDDMARCQQLYGTWSKYNGTSSYSKDVDADMAVEDCRKGNYSAGIGELTKILQRGQIPVPPVESAASH